MCKLALISVFFTTNFNWSVSFCSIARDFFACNHSTANFYYFNYWARRAREKLQNLNTNRWNLIFDVGLECGEISIGIKGNNRCRLLTFDWWNFTRKDRERNSVFVKFSNCFNSSAWQQMIDRHTTCNKSFNVNRSFELKPKVKQAQNQACRAAVMLITSRLEFEAISTISRYFSILARHIVNVLKSCNVLQTILRKKFLLPFAWVKSFLIFRGEVKHVIT